MAKKSTGKPFNRTPNNREGTLKKKFKWKKNAQVFQAQ